MNHVAKRINQSINQSTNQPIHRPVHFISDEVPQYTAAQLSGKTTITTILTV